MEIPALQPAPLMADLSLERLAHDPQMKDDQKIAQLARQFEAVLLRQILASARKTVIHSDSNDDSAVSGVYQDMITSQLAESISRSGDFGVARSLQAQLTHQTLSAKPADLSTRPPAPPAAALPLSAHHD
jgi:peptidoglycan hydrolase FlgJ